MPSLRGLPYRMVCVLGLDDGAFPAAHRPAEFDLIARHPRPGDRQRRQDERNLFLDLLLAARERLYLSHTGPQRARQQPPAAVGAGVGAAGPAGARAGRKARRRTGPSGGGAPAAGLRQPGLPDRWRPAAAQLPRGIRGPHWPPGRRHSGRWWCVPTTPTRQPPTLPRRKTARLPTWTASGPMAARALRSRQAAATATPVRRTATRTLPPTTQPPAFFARPLPTAAADTPCRHPQPQPVPAAALLPPPCALAAAAAPGPAAARRRRVAGRRRALPARPHGPRRAGAPPAAPPAAGRARRAANA